MNAHIFREYDIRGLVDKDLTVEVVELLGKGLGTVVRRKGGRSIVVGRDCRESSTRFRDALCRGLTSTGLNVLDVGVVPTPLTYFAANTLPVDGLAMITGSHNPPEYNGFKVYWENAAQIIPPHDTAIATAIDAAPPADEVPRVPLEDARARGLIRDFPEDLEATYLRALRGLAVRSDGDRSVRIVYTPLHGVGGDENALLRRAKSGLLRSIRARRAPEPPPAPDSTRSRPSPGRRGPGF